MRNNYAVRLILSTLTAAAFLAVVGCTAEKKEHDGDAKEGSSSAQSASNSGSTAATGDTIVVELWTDATGNYFKPKEIEAHPGDVISYKLGAGVHNVHFLPDSNQVKEGLPVASEMLQLPGQTYDLVVSLKPGKYYFQCDPHAALGMKGELEVEDKD
jgi:plastocyanin